MRSKSMTVKDQMEIMHKLNSFTKELKELDNNLKEYAKVQDEIKKKVDEIHRAIETRIRG